MIQSVILNGPAQLYAIVKKNMNRLETLISIVIYSSNEFE